jgi:hypothetical protein
VALYKLFRDDCDPDEFTAFVIRAESEAAARAVAAFKCGQEGPRWWTDPELSTCELLEPDGPEGVILIDFWEG